MILECGTGLVSMNAGEGEVRGILGSDRARGGYMTLTQLEHVFLQATGQGDGPYLLEYGAGDARVRYRATTGITKAQAEAAFLSYLAGDGHWQHSVQWQPVRPRPWWRLW